MACLPPESDDERDRGGSQETGEQVGSVFDRRKCLRRSGQRVGKQPEERPTCATCGEPLVARGKQKRRMQATMGREIELERTYGTCPTCGTGFFPLDEE